MYLIESKQPEPINATIQGMITLSVIVPVFNEQEMLPVFHDTLCSVLATMPEETFEIVYVNDGSSDESWEIMKDLRAERVAIKRLNLSRNFGKEAAMSAGLDHTFGSCVVILDADLQDPPHLIPAMLEAWRQGYDVVNMKRSRREGESRLKIWTSHLYYRLLGFLADVPLPMDVGDFRLLSRRVVEQIKRMPERNRYMKGIMSWPGFKQTTLSFPRPERPMGATSWSYRQLINLALKGVTSFSIKPLKAVTWIGVVLLLLAGSCLLLSFVHLLFGGSPVMGASFTLFHVFLAAVQLIAIGVLGEYVGRIYIESMGRPVYLVMDIHTTPIRRQKVSNGY